MIKLYRCKGVWVVADTTQEYFIGSLKDALIYAYGYLNKPVKVF